MATTVFNKPIDTEVNDLATNKMDKPTNAGVLDQILRNDGNGGSVWSNAASSSEIGTAVTNWLNTNVPTGTTVAIDRSLLIDGAAANASTVGDEIAAINNTINAAPTEATAQEILAEEEFRTLYEQSLWKDLGFIFDNLPTDATGNDIYLELHEGNELLEMIARECAERESA